MLSVNKNWRKRGIGKPTCHLIISIANLVLASTLVQNSLNVMKEHGVEEVKLFTHPTHMCSLSLSVAYQFRIQVVLETEFDNFAALSLYESLGFIREKRLFRFYLNGKDAFRLVLEIPANHDTGLNSEAPKLIGGLSSRRQPHCAISTSYSDDSEDEVSSR